jgi:hypothetical protein
LVFTAAHNPCPTKILSTHQFPHTNTSWTPFQFLCPFLHMIPYPSVSVVFNLSAPASREINYLPLPLYILIIPVYFAAVPVQWIYSNREHFWIS